MSAPVPNPQSNITTVERNIVEYLYLLSQGGGGGSPVNISPPSIAVQGGGDPFPGEMLQGTPGTWSGSPTLTYQWRRDGVDIGGQTSIAGYTLTEEDFGASITLLEIPNGVSASGVSSNVIDAFDPEALGTLLSWQHGSDLGDVGNPASPWSNRSAGGYNQLEGGGAINDFLGPKGAAFNSLEISNLESNGPMGWSGSDFYFAALLATVTPTSSDGNAFIISMNAGDFAVFIDSSDLVNVSVAGSPYVFTDAVYPGSNTLFILEAWRENDDIHCALNGIDSALTFTDAAVVTDNNLIVGNWANQTGILLAESLFYEGMASDRSSIRDYLLSLIP